MSGEQVDRQVERSPPGVDRRRAPAIRRAERGEHQRGLRRAGEVRRRPGRGRSSACSSSSSSGTRPRDLLRLGVDLTSPPRRRTASSTPRVTSPTARSGVSATRSAPPVAVLDERLVRAQIERHHDRPGPVRRRQWERLPAARGQPQRCVLELRLGRGQCHRELAEHLSVGVERVAGRRPLVVGELWPLGCHSRTLSARPVRTCDSRVANRN